MKTFVEEDSFRFVQLLKRLGRFIHKQLSFLLPKDRQLIMFEEKYSFVKLVTYHDLITNYEKRSQTYEPSQSNPSLRKT